MLIGIDASRALRPTITGTERYSLELISHLLAVKSGHHLRLYTPVAPTHTFVASPGWEASVIPFPRLWTHLRLSWEMLRRPPDILFIPAHVIPIIHPRSAVTIHDLGYLHYPEAHRFLDRLYLDLATRFNARAARHLIADSQATKRDLVTYYRVREDRITVIYPGCSLNGRPNTESTKKYHLPQKYILHLGTIQPRKNLSRLLEAFRLLLSRGQDVDLVLAGKLGWLYEGIVREAGATERVHLPGYIAPEDLSAVVQEASLLAMPSLYEGFGFPVLEAMALGVPVVCSNVSSLPEVAGDAALLIDPCDVEGLAGAMERALTDSELRAELIAKGKKRAAEFSWERCARETLAVLEKVGRGG